MKFLALIFCAAVALAAETPKLEFDKTVFDFGNATEGDEFTGKFLFRNAGSAELKLGKPESSCGCTHVKIHPETLQPGETGEINFVLDLVNIRGDVKKTIAIPSNDPEQPTATLTVIGYSKPVYAIEPEVIYFGEVPPGETDRETIQVRRLDGKPVVVATAAVTSDFLRTIIETNGAVTVEVRGTGKPEQFGDILSVTMEGASKPAFHIPVAGEFVPSLIVDPSLLIWKMPDSGLLRKIVVSSTLTNRVLDIGNFSSTLEDMLVKVDETEKGQTFEISLKLIEPPDESERGLLTFDTNFADHPHVTVPIEILVPEPDAK